MKIKKKKINTIQWIQTLLRDFSGGGGITDNLKGGDPGLHSLPVSIYDNNTPKQHI